ncbi:16S rRNA (guanine(966)-N(2))-methyltransferase RsmD [Candidatus Erwinia haradaeae]|uniref:Ribosomal RNA small subunit methyltransferase D n=1 Tax=Candidatus Erwinia haradaeae TaxID=1922217 RepID=A0A451D9B5_9GAMM|nr:16S rRNA (guanine(966)-N(2))-methyltransferase RsmD [Candidatus Erwinia haradaeae]VFP82901.1 Ribosomal RNA small subunit methyltransferase D [Candidatus Erwinia haradaeae]
MYKQNANKMHGQIRIIGGQWRGRKIPVINHPDLRPTPNRVRETLFNWLAGPIKDSKCLDCFSGTGALGFEALSRYAISATFLEIQTSIVARLKKNLVTLKAKNGYVIQTNTLKFLSQKGELYNVVFVDPPFNQDIIAYTLILLENNSWLHHQSLIYVESSVTHPKIPAPKNWFLYREIIAGQVISRLYRRFKETRSNMQDE